MPIPEQERGGFSPHGPECWRVHLTCAVAEVECLKAEVEQCHAKATCCCGDYVKYHSVSTGHTPLSMYDYDLQNMGERAVAAEAALATAQTDLAAVAYAMLRVERADMTKPLGPQVAACFDMLFRTMKRGEAEQDKDLERAEADARIKTLEEAAKICEARISTPDSHNAPYNAEDTACAEAIRALKDRKP